jgi:hypothetical protein
MFSNLLPLFQIVSCSDFLRYIASAMYLDVYCAYIHSESNVSRKAETTYNLE